MDILMQAAIAYKQLLHKEYTITFNSGETVRLIFKPGNFSHLVGLHKLSDLYYVSSPGYSASRVFKMALSGELTYSDLNCSIYFDSESRDRLECVCRIAELLCVSEKAVHKFDPRLCRLRVKFRADTIFFKDDGYDFFITFGVAKDKDGDYHYPETTFYRFDCAYIVSQRILTISDVKVFDFKKSAHNP